MKRVVRVGRPDVLDAKLRALREASIDGLHVILDFDKTLTHPESDTSWSLLQRHRFSPAFVTGTQALYDKYHPIEIDERLSVAERYKAMNDWWNDSHALLLAENVSRDTFRCIVETHGTPHLYFRDNADSLVAKLAAWRVPLLIFSAGLGDLIDACMERQGWLSSAHVVSNHLRYNEARVATGFVHDNIHTFSKCEAVLPELHEAWFQDVAERRNVIVVGDAVGDAHMADGVPHDCVLRIGFLNPGQESSLDEYLGIFDVVLQNDPSFDYVLNLVEELCGSRKQ